MPMLPFCLFQNTPRQEFEPVVFFTSGMYIGIQNNSGQKTHNSSFDPPPAKKNQTNHKTTTASCLWVFLIKQNYVLFTGIVLAQTGNTAFKSLNAAVYNLLALCFLPHQAAQSRRGPSTPDKQHTPWLFPSSRVLLMERARRSQPHFEPTILEELSTTGEFSLWGNDLSPHNRCGTQAQRVPQNYTQNPHMHGN